MNFTGAGCFFFNEQFCLAGYQPRKKRPYFSGLGGKREGEEDFLTTALRETLEELFELQTVPPEWIYFLQTLPQKGLLKQGEYVSVLYSFDTLLLMLDFLNKEKCVSKLYDIFPTSLFDLIMKRKQRDPLPEISHLSLLPLLLHAKDTPFVSPFFLKDIKLLLQSNHLER